MRSRKEKPHDEWLVLYEHYLGVLVLLGTSRLGLGEPVARELAHGVLVASLFHMQRVPDPGTWMAGAMAAAAGEYRKGGDV
ncbi:MAG TPA: hypothetical protein VEK57_13245 [Thermoanaerobaculia bacterium]|nr:hypothetical protein [Thermoanaerobaculia bacterium]